LRVGLAARDDRRFGKYTLVAKLAIGGMAEIFLARLSGAAGFEKLVCIKRILPQYARDPQFVSMFLAEARIAAQISHPNVCQVFELGEIDGRYFIAMEYLEGVPLAAFRRPDLYGAPPEARLIAGLISQAAEGLHHAHQLKRPDGTPMEVVHRDVSGNNMFATVDGVVKVLDFGIAKVQDASVRTSTGSVKGTYAYMAPEQLRGEKLDRRTDVFALGIVAWELLAQRHLFKRETDFLTFQAITTDRIADVCELRPDVPPDVGAAIAKALARETGERWATARQFGEALVRAVLPLGGPMAASGIGEELERGFANRMRDQRKLISLARNGGELELDVEAELAFGHGTAMLTTPVSIVSGLRPAKTEVSAPQLSAILPAPIAAPKPTLTIDAPSEPSRSRLPWIVASFAITIAAGVLIWQLALSPKQDDVVAAAAGESGESGPHTVARDGGARGSGARNDDEANRWTTGTGGRDGSTGTDVAPSGSGSTAGRDGSANGSTAGAGQPASSGSGATTTNRNGSKSSTSTSTTSSTSTSTTRAPAGAARPKAPAGPPGFITIDSTPVYATIYIDGKKLGETPLVRVSLPPGKHAVKAVSASGGTKVLSITIESGKVAPTRRIEW